MYVTLYEYYGDKHISTVIISQAEWERAGRPANVQEYETWRMIHDPDVRARFEAERDQAMELDGEYDL